MEEMVEIWRHQSLFGRFPEEAIQLPDGESDLIFTSRRIVAVGRTREQGTGWAWGAFAGPLGVLATGTAATLWEGYQRMTRDPKLSTDVLEQLLANGMALSASYDSLRCEVIPQKRTWDDYLSIVPDSYCLIAFYGLFASGGKLFRGALCEHIDTSAPSMVRKLRRIASLHIETRDSLPMMDLFEEPSRRLQEINFEMPSAKVGCDRPSESSSCNHDSNDPGTRLKRVDELFAQGLISDEEHRQKRKQVIDEL